MGEIVGNKEERLVETERQGRIVVCTGINGDCDRQSLTSDKISEAVLKSLSTGALEGTVELYLR